MTQDDPALSILNRMADERERRESIQRLPDGVAVHAIEQSLTFGANSTTLEGNLLIEEKGTIRRATGKDIAMLDRVAPDFLKHWRLREAD